MLGLKVGIPVDNKQMTLEQLSKEQQLIEMMTVCQSLKSWNLTMLIQTL